jgi:hypothetical protein
VQVPATSRYLRLDLSQVLGGHAASSGGVGSFDARSNLSLLLGASSLHRVGTSVVRGVATTHLYGTLDTARALNAVTPALRRLTVALATGLHLPASFPIDVWVDSAGLPRRLAFRYSLPAQNLGGVAIAAATFTSTTDYYDYGVAVRVTPPPPSSVLSGG